MHKQKSSGPKIVPSGTPIMDARVKIACHLLEHTGIEHLSKNSSSSDGGFSLDFYLR